MTRTTDQPTARTLRLRRAVTALAVGAGVAAPLAVQAIHPVFARIALNHSEAGPR